MLCCVSLSTVGSCSCLYNECNAWLCAVGVMKLNTGNEYKLWSGTHPPWSILLASKQTIFRGIPGRLTQDAYGRWLLCSVCLVPMLTVLLVCMFIWTLCSSQSSSPSMYCFFLRLVLRLPSLGTLQQFFWRLSFFFSCSLWLLLYVLCSVSLLPLICWNRSNRVKGMSLESLCDLFLFHLLNSLLSLSVAFLLVSQVSLSIPSYRFLLLLSIREVYKYGTTKWELWWIVMTNMMVSLPLSPF